MLKPTQKLHEKKLSELSHSERDEILAAQAESFKKMLIFLSGKPMGDGTLANLLFRVDNVLTDALMCVRDSCPTCGKSKDD